MRRQGGKKHGTEQEKLTIWLLPIDGGTSIWGGGREYYLAPYAVPFRRRRRGVVDGLQYRVDE